MSTTSGTWSGRAQAYAETFAGQCAHAIGPLLDALRPLPGARLLDVGTGPGGVSAAARAAGCEVTGVDPEADMLALAALAVPGAPVVQAGLPRLPFADGAFGLVTANFVLNHVADPVAAAGELRRVVTPGGRVGVSVWPSVHRPIRQLWQDVLAEAGVPEPDALLASEADFARTPDGLAGLLAGAGLTVERAWEHDFVHVVDAELWWRGVTGGVASIGRAWLGQDAAGRAAMRAAYDRLAPALRDGDGMLHLRGAAVLAVGQR